MKEKENLLYFSCFAEDMINLYTKKPFDFGSNKSEKEKENELKIIKKIVNCDFKFIKPIQKHTNIVKEVTSDNINDSFENVDGLITNIRGVALGTVTADCQSIFLYDPVKKVIGNIHSGWKGTLNRIVENAIKKMVSSYGSATKDIIVGICPSILQCCFEVDRDVKDMFLDSFPDIDIKSCISPLKNDKYYIDTVLVNKCLLLNLGIKKENIHLANICTKCNHDKFYSHRGSHGDGGRNLAIISLKDDKGDL